MTFDDRLDALEERLGEIETEWSNPDVAVDPDRRRELGREQAQIEPVVTTYRELKEVRAALADARELEQDPEMRELARDEIEAKERREQELVEQLRVQLLPRDPNDDRNVIVEI